MHAKSSLRVSTKSEFFDGCVEIFDHFGTSRVRFCHLQRHPQVQKARN
jgi:hypothetical protein